MPAMECYECVVAGATKLWANTVDYERCPLCGEPTVYQRDEDSMPPGVARAAILDYQASPRHGFDLYCAKQEAERRAKLDAEFNAIVEQLGPISIPTTADLADEYDVAFCATHGIAWPDAA